MMLGSFWKVLTLMNGLKQCCSKDYWQLVKRLYGNKHNPSIPTMIEEGNAISSTLKKANLFNNHCINKAKLPEADKLLSF